MIVKVDVTFDASAQFLHVGKHVTVEVLVLEDGPERFDARVVEATAGATHGANDAELVTKGHDIVIGELTTAVAVKPNSV